VYMKRCLTGTRRNRKTGECYKITERVKPVEPVQLLQPLVIGEQPNKEKLLDDKIQELAMEVEVLTEKEKIKRTRCPKGTRKNKNGDCVKKKDADEPEVTEKRIDNDSIPDLSDKPEPVITKVSRDETKKPEPFDASTDCKIPEVDGLNCENENYYSKDCNRFLLKKEIIEGKCIDNNNLYPNLNDSQFNIKISAKKEFSDTRYDGEIHTDIASYADKLAKADFELQPHQAFVKNFMSAQTPYNSLLLYHGLGSGKTCSAIGVCEEMRDYMKQMGITQRIIIVASENVQDNFKIQLFDERRLKNIDGLWVHKGCIGNKLIKEINPMNMRGLTKDKIIGQVRNLINSYYLFTGYDQFANYINNTMNPGATDASELTINEKGMRRLRNEFNNRLIVIDEVHNIRKTDDNKNKKVANFLEVLVKCAENMRLLLLSATPMYNSYKEIIWLLNLMNINDRRGYIETKDVFDSYGKFKPGGQELLIKKATGYISYVRGENPYTFPYRVYPNEFAEEKTFPEFPYPSHQMNLKRIDEEDKKRILSLYLNKIGNCGDCGNCQYCVYRYIIHKLRNKEFSITTKKGVVKNMPSFANMESFGYTLLQKPLEALIMTYPNNKLKAQIDKIPKEKYVDELSEDFDKEVVENASMLLVDDENLNPVEPTEGKIKPDKKTKVTNEKQVGGSVDAKDLTGRGGLKRFMKFDETTNPPNKGNFEYKETGFGRIFSADVIGKYSSKIKSILENIYKNGSVAKGVILIYSQFIDSGLIPMALALEEMGFTRYGEDTKPLFKNKPTDVVEVGTMKPPKDKKKFSPARYSMITGDPRLSPNNVFEIKGLTNEDNKNGDKVKVVLISKAGSEGIDLKYIRQVHILEPWYNMNRVEQIIGRAVRNLSHKDLPFEERNVQIFMHGTILEDENKQEAADMYVYRVAEYKAVQMGKVSRLLKETAVDCIINHEQVNFTQEVMSSVIEKPITQNLSDGKKMEDFKVGDMPNSFACDYMEKCAFDCRPKKKIAINEEKKEKIEDAEDLDTYNEKFIQMNNEKILQRIRELMKESVFYKKDVLIKKIQTQKKYPLVQIYSSLTQLIDDKNEFINDRFGRVGRLINVGEYYLFQPIELTNNSISIFERQTPIDYKHDNIEIIIDKDIVKPKPSSLDIFTTIKSRYESTLAIKTIDRGNKNWYEHCGMVMKKINNDYPGIDKHLNEFLLAHIIETLFFADKLELLNYIYSINPITPGSLEAKVKQYFERRIIVTPKVQAILLYDLKNEHFVKLGQDNKWSKMGNEDRKYLESTPEGKKLMTFDAEKYNSLVGFMGYENNNQSIVFKTKDITKPRDIGARCDEAGKIKVIQSLNKIVGTEKYTSDNTKQIKTKKGVIEQEAIGLIDLCIIKEFVLRYKDITDDNKKWFLTPEMAIHFFNK
jgi:superfamily II DNA or RNA helicase